MRPKSCPSLRLAPAAARPISALFFIQLTKIKRLISFTPLEVAETFFTHWQANRVEEALAMLAAEVIHPNFFTPYLIGREKIVKFHADAGIDTVLRANWEIVHLAAVGKMVLNEQIGSFQHANGFTLTIPGMSTLTIEDGTLKNPGNVMKKTWEV